MKNIKRIIIALIVLTALVVISCEVSSILLSEDIRTSQPRNDIRWKNITIVPTKTTTGDTTTVDAAVLISARGVHVFYQAQNQDGGTPLSYGDLTKPTFANDKDNYGIFYDCYVPGNYDSDSSAYVILTASKPKPGAEIQYYVLDLKKLVQHKDEPEQVKTALSLVENGVTSASPSDAHDKKYGIKKSSAINSDYLLYRSNDETVYCLGRMNVSDSNGYKITLSTERSFKAPPNNNDNNNDGGEIKGIDRIWENKQGDRAVVKYTKYHNDVKSYEKYATVKLAENQSVSEDNSPQPIKELSNDDDNMHFDHFFVYEDNTSDNKLAWMGIRTDGRVYHSHSKGSNLVCNGNFSYDRYSPVASLYISAEEKGIEGGGEVGLSLLSRNSSTGFIITSFRKMPGTDNKSIIHQEESSITTGFAEDFRSEDIAVFGYFKENPVNGSKQHLVVLSVEVGAETYHIDSSKPSLIKTNTSVARDKIDLPYATLAP